MGQRLRPRSLNSDVHMLQRMAPSLLGLAIGCNPCASEPNFDVQTQPLQTVYDDFMSWTGSDGLCINDVNIDPPVGLRDYARHREIGVSDGPNATTELRRGLCVALDRETNVSGCGGACETSFADSCQLGPPMWAEASLQACGETGLNDTEQFLADNVYPFFEGLPEEQHLSGVLGPPIVIPDGLSWSIQNFASVNGALYRMENVWDDHDERVALIDRLNLNGTIEAVAEHRGTTPLMDGGDALVLWDQSWPQGHHTSTLEEIGVGLVHTVTPGLRIDHGVVSEGVWYAPQIYYVANRPMVAVNLESGHLSILPLPPVPDGLTPLFYQPVAAPGGFVVLVSHAVVTQVESDFLVLDVHDFALERYDASTKRWTRLLHGPRLRFYPAGTTDEGIVMGTLAAGQHLLAGYDLNTEHFRVSHDICLQTDPLPWVIDGKAWSLDIPDEPDATDLVIRPFVLNGK